MVIAPALPPHPSDLAALFAQTENPAPLPPVEGSLPGTPPEPLFMEHCSAQQSCPGGGSVSCTGHTSCLVYSDAVVCDGDVQLPMHGIA